LRKEKHAGLRDGRGQFPAFIEIYKAYLEKPLSICCAVHVSTLATQGTRVEAAAVAAKEE
jgi:hypothetical protein